MSSENILRICPHFQKIVNFNYQKDDMITKKLIYIYRDFISKANYSNATDVKMVRELDVVLDKYLDDYLFRKELKSEIVNIRIKRSCSDILRAIIENILKIFDQYLYNTTRIINIARWI